MITVKCPVRISLVGGSSDLDAYVEKHKKGSVISFTPQIYTYVSIYKDLIGKNTLEQKYIINYSVREEVSSIVDIKNSLVKIFFEKENVMPCSIHMTSDVFSHGSGLASSSSYACGLSKAIAEFNNTPVSDIECGARAHYLEKLINPLLGQQDIFGCVVGGFKKIEFIESGLPKYTFLPTKFFDFYTPYLIFTGLTRNSTEVLKSVSIPEKDIFNTLVEQSEQYILNEKYENFLNLISCGWQEKKNTSKEVLKNVIVKEMDDYLSSYPKCISHKLCGAGNGGFFLCFFPIDSPPTDSRFIKMNISNKGIERVI